MTGTPTRNSQRARGWITAGGWACLLAALTVLQRARPQRYSYDRFFGVHGRRRVWDLQAVDQASWMILAALLLGAVSLGLAQGRPRSLGKPWASLALAAGALCAFLGHLWAFRLG